MDSPADILIASKGRLEYLDNESAGIYNDTIKQQRSHATNMGYFCIRYQKTF